MQVLSSHKCANCKHPFEIYLEDKYAYGCPSCFAITLYKHRSEQFEHEGVFTTFKKLKYKLILNSEGTINGEKYKLVGQTRIKEKGDDDFWYEYILINNKGEYKTLFNYDSVWLLYSDETKNPNKFSPKKSDDLFNKYFAILKDCTGEIPYNFKQRVRSHTKEWLTNDALYVEEAGNSAHEKNHYKGVYVDAKEIAGQFTKSYIDTSNKHNPLRPNNNVKPMSFIYMYGMMLLIGSLFQIFINSTSSPKNLLVDEFPTVSFNRPIKEIVTKKFNVSPNSILGNNNVELTISTPLNNEWLDLYITLLNTETGNSVTIHQPIEYYSGYTDGENWSEGSQSVTAFFSGIEAGKYCVIINPYIEKKSTFFVDSLTIITDDKEAGSDLVNVGDYDGKHKIYSEDLTFHDTETPNWGDEFKDNNLFFKIQITEGVDISINYVLFVCIMAAIIMTHYIKWSIIEEDRWYLSNQRRNE